MEDIVGKWGVRGDHVAMFVNDLVADKKRWVDFMMREELGILEDSGDKPAVHGLVTFVSFAIAGTLPLVPYLFGVPTGSQFIVSIIATAMSLFAVGASRSLVTSKTWFRSGLEMLLVGGLASAAAFAIGGLVKNIVA